MDPTSIATDLDTLATGTTIFSGITAYRKGVIGKKIFLLVVKILETSELSAKFIAADANK